jgi:hypothetical protein
MKLPASIQMPAAASVRSADGMYPRPCLPHSKNSKPVCGNTSILNGPSTDPAGAVVVPAGNNNALTLSWNNPSFAQAGKTFWFAPGVHTLGTGQYDQIGPGTGTALIGAPGAIVDGQGKNEVAFGGANSNVTIKYLTIQNFVGPNDQGTINHDQATSWTDE